MSGNAGHPSLYCRSGKVERGSGSATLSRILEAALLRLFLGGETKEANRELARISRLEQPHEESYFVNMGIKKQQQRHFSYDPSGNSQI